MDYTSWCDECGLQIGRCGLCNECSKKGTQKNEHTDVQNNLYGYFEIYQECKQNMDALEDSFSREVVEDILKIVFKYVDEDYIEDIECKLMTTSSYNDGFEDGKKCVAPQQLSDQAYMFGYRDAINELLG